MAISNWMDRTGRICGSSDEKARISLHHTGSHTPERNVWKFHRNNENRVLKSNSRTTRINVNGVDIDICIDEDSLEGWDDY